ncbi:LexA family transcriptional regulator, partial [Pseudomonas aeruginosa]
MSRRRRPLNPHKAIEYARLKAIYLKRKAEASAREQAITQESVGEACGWASAQSTVDQYVTGKLALTIDALLSF